MRRSAVRTLRTTLILQLEMSFAARKPVSTDQAIPSRRISGTPATIPSTRPLSKSSVPSDTVQASGLARTPSNRKENVPMSARAAAARRVGNRSSTSLGSVSALHENGADEDARAENAQLVAELKQQLQKAEIASEQYQKQLEVLQMRLDEVLTDQNRLEERDSQHDGEIQALRLEVKDFARQKRDLEQSYESEKAIILKEREEQADKEGELQSVIRRLNETIRQRDLRSHGSERFGSPQSRESKQPNRVGQH